jgi:FAD/FMN-containing dehydrogenase
MAAYEELATALPGRVVFPTSAQYVESSQSYFAAFENELKPACIALPHTAEDVATIIRYAQRAKGAIQLAVRSGGHTAWEGAANIENGLVIDLRNLSLLEVSHGVASIGTGNHWGDVYGALEKQGLAVVGGRVSKVGVGGLVTGGMPPNLGFPS